MTTVVSASSQYSHIWVLPVTPQSQLKAQHGLSASRHSVFEPHLQWKLYFILLWRLERCPFFYASSSLHPTNIKMLPYARQYLTELGMRVNHRHFTRSVQTYSKCCLVLRSCLPCSVKYLKHLFRARDSHIETCLLLIHHSNVYNSLTTQPDEEACRHSQETRTGAVKQLSCHCCFLGCTSAGNQNQLEVTLEPIHSNMGCECPNCFLTQTLPKPTLFSTLSMDIKLQNVITCCYCS